MEVETSSRAEPVAPSADGSGRRRSPRRAPVAAAAVGVAFLGAAVVASWPTATPELVAGFAGDVEVTGAPWASVSSPVAEAVTVAEAGPDLRVERMVTISHDLDRAVPLVDVDAHLEEASGRLTRSGCTLAPVGVEAVVVPTTGAVPSRSQARPFSTTLTIGPGETAVVWVTSALRDGGEPCLLEPDSELTASGVLAATTDLDDPDDPGAGSFVHHPAIVVTTDDLDTWLDEHVRVVRG